METSCSSCIYKNKCYYTPLEEWEERFCYPPCRWISEPHSDYIRDHIFKVMNEYEF